MHLIQALAATRNKGVLFLHNVLSEIEIQTIQITIGSK